MQAHRLTFELFMKSLTRSALLPLAFLAPWSHAAALDPALDGCWRAVKIVVLSPDGSKMEDPSGRCTLQFKDDQLISACGTSNGKATTTYQVQMVRPGFYATTMAGSTFRTDLVGSTREYEYHVDGNRLTTVAKPQGKPLVTSSKASRVDLEAEKVPCE